MGSDSNCNNFYQNVDQNSATNIDPYYQTLSIAQNGSSQSSVLKNVNNEWIASETSVDNQDSESENQRDHSDRSDASSAQSHKSFAHTAPSQQHVQMSATQWNFPSAFGNSYQRFYTDSHYGIVISPNVSQQSSLMSTPSSSLHSLNGEPPPSHHHVHQMQTSQHLKKIYYQGLSKTIRCLPLPRGRSKSSAPSHGLFICLSPWNIHYAKRFLWWKAEFNLSDCLPRASSSKSRHASPAGPHRIASIGAHK